MPSFCELTDSDLKNDESSSATNGIEGNNLFNSAIINKQNSCSYPKLQVHLFQKNIKIRQVAEELEIR